MWTIRHLAQVSALAQCVRLANLFYAVPCIPRIHRRRLQAAHAWDGWAFVNLIISWDRTKRFGAAKRLFHPRISYRLWYREVCRLLFWTLISSRPTFFRKHRRREKKSMKNKSYGLSSDWNRLQISAQIATRFLSVYSVLNGVRSAHTKKQNKTEEIHTLMPHVMRSKRH